jgi:SOS-response transcriptional repressor LexA
VAIISNCVEAARLLLEFGADQSLNIMQFEKGCDEVSNTAALDLAKRLKLREMIEMLIGQKETIEIQKANVRINGSNKRRGWTVRWM